MAPPPQSVDALPVSALDHLLAGGAQARVTGPLAWSTLRGGNVVGASRIETSLEVCPQGEVRCRLMEKRPNRVHLQYLANGVALRRVDLNDRHGPAGPIGHHMHTYRPADGSERVDDVDNHFRNFAPSTLPLDETLLEEIYDTFLKLCGLEGRGTWTSPPPPLGTGGA